MKDPAGTLGNPAPRRTPTPLKVLAVVLLVEAVAMAAVTVMLLVEVVTQPSAGDGGGIALAILGVLAVGFLGVLLVGTLRGQTWIRGPVFTWQLLQLAVAVGAFQGAFARPDIGWLLILPAVVGIALLFVPSVMNATRRPL
ncbi:MAG: hypothetical protein JWP66_697 [Naasia sp.]|nr:hypothetical protein [Naasia sp.]